MEKKFSCFASRSLRRRGATKEQNQCIKLEISQKTCFFNENFQAENSMTIGIWKCNLWPNSLNWVSEREHVWLCTTTQNSNCQPCTCKYVFEKYKVQQLTLGLPRLVSYQEVEVPTKKGRCFQRVFIQTSFSRRFAHVWQRCPCLVTQIIRSRTFPLKTIDGPIPQSRRELRKVKRDFVLTNRPSQSCALVNSCLKFVNKDFLSASRLRNHFCGVLGRESYSRQKHRQPKTTTTWLTKVALLPEALWLKLESHLAFYARC